VEWLGELHASLDSMGFVSFKRTQYCPDDKNPWADGSWKILTNKFGMLNLKFLEN
jgi:hypothetical protein